jgi:hypothetical protein
MLFDQHFNSLRMTLNAFRYRNKPVSASISRITCVAGYAGSTTHDNKPVYRRLHVAGIVIGALIVAYGP